MLHSSAILKMFETLGRSRPTLSLAEGMRVGRGFADVGYEEFLILSNNKLVSLLTGTVSSLDEMRREHLFEILNLDQIVREIHRQGFEIVDVRCIEMRTWEASIKNNAGEVCATVEARSMDECFLKLALAVHQTSVTAEERCLKTEMVNG